MSIFFDGTEIDQKNSIFFGGTEVMNVFFNGVEVWKKATGNILAMYYGDPTSTGTRYMYDADCVAIGTNVALGTAREGTTAATLPDIAMFWAGSFGSDRSSIVTRFDIDGNLIGSETNAGFERSSASGGSIGDVALFHAGNWQDGGNTRTTNKLTRVGVDGLLIAEAAAGAELASKEGASFEDIFMSVYGSYSSDSNSVMIFDADGITLISTNVGTGRSAAAGAGAEDRGIFYGGWHYNLTGSRTLTMVDSSGVLVGSESSIGDKDSWGGGGSRVEDILFLNSTGVTPGIARFNRFDLNGVLVGFVDDTVLPSATEGTGI